MTARLARRALKPMALAGKKLKKNSSRPGRRFDSASVLAQHTHTHSPCLNEIHPRESLAALLSHQEGCLGARRWRGEAADEIIVFQRISLRRPPSSHGLDAHLAPRTP